ncbi:MAG TPA: hypothetical protein VN493_11675 [Thermoanaerobaculia bacterium]|nr:hypothetical protein [Thermoanaerobaculia bacterium]
MTATTYAPQGITRARRRGPHPGVHVRKGRPVKAKFRGITIRVEAKRYKEWLRASGAIEFRDLRNWLIFLADREAEATDPRQIINPS